MKSCLVGCAIFSALLASSAFGAIQVAVSGTTVCDVNLLSDTTTGTVSGTNLSIGEATVDQYSSRAYIPFTLSAADKAALSDPNAKVTLNVLLASVSNATGLTADLYGLSNRGSDPLTKNNDYSSGELIQSGIFTGASTSKYYSFDVTSFVKAQAVNNNVVAFKIQIAQTGLPIDDDKQNAFILKSGDHATSEKPFLDIVATPIPEPASIVPVAGGSLAALGLLRRK